MDKVSEAILVDNDELYILHKPRADAFTLKHEDRK